MNFWILLMFVTYPDHNEVRQLRQFDTQSECLDNEAQSRRLIEKARNTRGGIAIVTCTTVEKAEQLKTIFPRLKGKGQ